ncbi:DUF4142 domain-containing protein [Azospirillum sp. sgz302134]
MRRAFVAVVVLASMGGSALAQQPLPLSRQDLSRQERNFIIEALADSMAERALGKLAQDRAETDSVRGFARRAVDDHGRVAQQLAGMAERHDIPIPQELNTTARSHMASLRDTPDGAFDRRYIAAEEETHARAIKLFEAQAERDGETADFARDTLPMLHAHFEDARAIAAELSRRPGPPQTQAPPATSGSSE